MRHPVLSKEQFYTDAGIHWLGPQQGAPNWADPKCKALACLIHGRRAEHAFPDVQRGHGGDRLWVASAAAGLRLASSSRFVSFGAARLVRPGEEAILDHSKTFRVAARSSAILLARKQKPASEEGRNESTSLRDTASSNFPFQPLSHRRYRAVGSGLVDFMVRSGQRWWQMLPIGPAGEDNSPYKSPSAFGGNPLLVSPDRLVSKPESLAARISSFLPPGAKESWNYPAAARLKVRC